MIVRFQHLFKFVLISAIIYQTIFSGTFAPQMLNVILRDSRSKHL